MLNRPVIIIYFNHYLSILIKKNRIKLKFYLICYINLGSLQGHRR